MIAATYAPMSVAVQSGETSAQANTAPGALPEIGTLVVSALYLGTPIPGAGEGTAPGIYVRLDITPAMLAKVDSVSVALVSPTGRTASASAQTGDGENLELLFIEFDEYDPSGEWALSNVRLSFDTQTYPDLPTEGLTLEAEQISSLINDRFVDIIVPEEDITPPDLSDLDLPSRGFTIANDNPFTKGGADSVEIAFDMTVRDPASGLNVIEFEFDIGPGSPAVVGGEWGLFGDIPGGMIDLSTFNTAAPAGSYVLTRLRVSDDQGNTHLLSTGELQEMGYETLVNVANADALDDSSAPSISGFSMAHSVTIGTSDANGTTLRLSFEGSDTGFDDTGIKSASLILTSATGGLYQFTVPVTLNGDGTGGFADFTFDATFPAGDFTIARLSINDAAFNRASLGLSDTSFTVINPYGGDADANRLLGDGGDNVIAARSGNDTVVGGAGSDHATLGAGDDFAWAGAGDTGRDTIIGGAGDDVISGGGGDDLLIGGKFFEEDIRDGFFMTRETRNDGEDILYGGAGDDTLYGGSPAFGESNGETTVDDLGSAAANTMYAGTGDDVAHGSYGGDTIGGGSGDDTLSGAGGHDVIYGGRGDGADLGTNDSITGGEGNDLIFTSGGSDRVAGGADNDTLFGGAGNDTVGGDGGHDHIYGGTGDDQLSGGFGDDRFYFQPGSGFDTITDFSLSDDTLVLTGNADSFASAAAVWAASTVVTIGGTSGLLINLGDGDSLFLEGINSAFALDIVI